MSINPFPSPSSLTYSAIKAAGRQSITSSDHDSIIADLAAIALSLSNLTNLLGGTPLNYPLTGLAYTVPPNTSLIRFTQNSVISSQTVILPVAMGDGQPLQFMNYYANINSLTFTPTVVGWTNTSQMAFPSAIKIRWDASLNTWFRDL